MAHDSDWFAIRRAYRAGVFKVLDDVRKGAVDEDSLGKLQNFCAVALMLMGKVEQRTWRICEREAELASLLVRDNENTTNNSN